MSSPEQFSEFDRDLQVELETFGLLLNVRETYSFAEKLNKSHQTNFTEANRFSRLRYILLEAPNRCIPIATKRVILKPDPETMLFNVDRMIIRVPDGARSLLPVEHPNDVFIETVSAEGERSRHILNSKGLWLYQNKDDLAPTMNYTETNDIFSPNDSALLLQNRMGPVSRILDRYLPVLQSSVNTERP